MKSQVIKNLPASIQAQLLVYAHREKTDFNLVLKRYGMERLLYRISKSRFADRFVLKGAVLFIAWQDSLYRPTLDLDLLAIGPSDTVSLNSAFREICGIACKEDALLFVPESVKAEQIRETNDFGGVRLYIDARLQKAKITLQVDCGFGDCITPEAYKEQFPTILDLPRPYVLMYPKETVVAEKFEAIVRFGEANSRMKDFYDLWVLASDFSFHGGVVSKAIENTFRQRKTTLPRQLPSGLHESFVENPLKQTQWRAFIRKNAFSKIEADFGKTISLVRKLVMPPLESLSTSARFEQLWVPGGPWQEPG
jgi:predicted nucleotidyltransferase component of viral defense system